MNLDYFRARYYSPHLGRSLRPDPQTRHQALNVPQFCNRYSYVRGNSMKYVDPDGQVRGPGGTPRGPSGDLHHRPHLERSLTVNPILRVIADRKNPPLGSTPNGHPVA